MPKKKRIFPPVKPQPPLQSISTFKKCFYHNALNPGDYQLDNDGNLYIPKWKQQLDESKSNPQLWTYYGD